MLSLIRSRNSSGQNPQINISTSSHPDRVTITAPHHILEGATLHVNVRTRTQSPVTMPLFPFITLEHAPYGFSRPLDPDYTYVMRHGRGTNRRNYFVRSVPRPPPPEPRVVILRRQPHPSPDPYEWCRTTNLLQWPQPPPWRDIPINCHRCSRSRRPRSPPPPPWRGPFGEPPPPSSSDGMSTEDLMEPRPTGPGRRVHWPDGHSDGSLSSDSSSESSDTSSDSYDGPRGGSGNGWRVPRTPSSSPVRGRGYPYPYPSSMCEDCDERCEPGPGSGSYGGYGRAGGGGSRWRDAPCRERPVWDRNLGYGVERAPRR